ncbi:hypothetical protein Nmel_004499 [Mimus melanotis]
MHLRRTSYLTMVCTTGCRRILAPETGAPHAPPSSVILVFAEFLSYIPTLFYSDLNYFCATTFFFLLKSVIPEAQALCLMG